MKKRQIVRKIEDLRYLRVADYEARGNEEATRYNSLIGECTAYWEKRLDGLGDERLVSQGTVGYTAGGGGDTSYWSVIGDLCDQFEFLGAESNNDIPGILEKAGITAKFDCESCCTYVYFQSAEEACDFVDKVNAYLLRKHEEVAAAARP
jgi:hypothetical protein